MKQFENAGVAVYALSYDESDALRDFRDAHQISYCLLSDPQSEVIRSFGILNTLIDENDHPWFGIPYPGTFVLDAEGRITHKFFDSNLAVRAGSDQLLRAIRGESPASPLDTEIDGGELSIRVYLDGESLTPTVQRDLVVAFKVPAGRHVYAEPAPLGSVAVNVTLDKNSIIVARELRRPAAVRHVLKGTEEEFDVHHTEFELRLPLTINNASAGETSLAGEIRWQSCDDEVCDIPGKQRFE